MENGKDKKDKKPLFTPVDEGKKENAAKPAEKTDDVKDAKDSKWSFIATFPAIFWHYFKPVLGFAWMIIFYIILIPLNRFILRPIKANLGTLPLIIITTVVAFIVIVVGAETYGVMAESDPWYARFWQWVFRTEPTTWISRVWEHWFS